MTNRFIGKPLKRKEDPRLIQGISHYVDDLQLAGMHFAAFLRTPYAHAKIRSVDLSKARHAPGVVLALSGADVDGAVQAVPCAAQIPDMKAAARPVLARDRVLFVGEAVAVVVANDRYAARDALDLIEVDYEPLTPIVNPEKAIAKGATPMHPRHKDKLGRPCELEAGRFKA